MYVMQRRALTLFLVMLVSSVVAMPFSAQAQDDASTVNVLFNGHVFDLPLSIANGFSAFIVGEPTEIPGSDSVQPPRTEFRLLVYTEDVNTPPAVGWVNVYDASDLEGYAASEQYERLRDLLSERPELNTEATLPTLYPYQQSALPPDRYTEFFINAAYLETEAYSGITFIYGRAIHLGDHEPVLFYRVYFEGMSSDNQRYISAQVEGPPAFTESLESITDPAEYVTQAKALFQHPSDEAISAWLGDAQLMFSSLGYTAQS